jgi:putative FmdB family regulatory protein
MPIYLYVCNHCGHELEALQKVSDPPIQECPACGDATLRKQVTAAAFRLKGTGWYETDFKNTGKKPADKKKAKEGKTAKETGSDSTKTDKAGDTKTGKNKSATGAKGG